MGKLITQPNVNDIVSIVRAISKLDAALNTDSTPTWGGGTITGDLSVGGSLDLTGTLTLSGLTASRLVATNADKELVSSDLDSWIAGTANQINVADDGDGTVTLSTPQDIHAGATPTFDDLTLTTPVNIYALSHNSFADYDGAEHFLQTAITNVSTALATGLLKVTTGTGALSVVTDNSANWNTAYGWGDHSSVGYIEDITGTANQVIVTDDGDNTVTLSTPQDIHTSASPQFVGLTLTGGLEVNNEATVSNYITVDGNYGFRLESGATRRALLFSAGTNVTQYADVSGYYEINMTDDIGPALRVNADGSLQFFALGAGLLQSDASGNISIDGSTYLTGITGESIGDLSDVDLTDIADEKILQYNSVSGNWECETIVATDKQVSVDAAATAGYLGAASNDGVLRTGTSIAYTDGGDYITLDLDIDSLTEDATPEAVADYVATYDDSAAGNKKVLLNKIGIGGGEFSTRTINLLTTDTAAQKQAKIDAVGRYIDTGVTITFQFADGTHTHDDVLSFNGFWGGGGLHVYGNTSEANATDLHTTQSVHIDCSSNTCDGIFVGRCTCNVRVWNLKVSINTTAGVYDGITVASCFSCFVFYNYVTGNSDTQGYAFRANVGFYTLRENYVSNVQYGIAVTNAIAYSNTNDDTGTAPEYGLWARNAAYIGKNSTQPAGSTANELTAGGSTIN